jgi:PAS domain S-box-containing protein
LLVDDREDNLYLLQSLLGASGWLPVLAHNGAEALARAREEPPALVISDLLMPVMDGYTLLHHWKRDEALAWIPFVVYTATYTDPRDERLALEMGADAFIVKPAEPEDFLRRIAHVLAGQRQNLASYSARPSIAEDQVLSAYSTVLVRKLEERALALEREVQRQKEAQAAAQSERNLSETLINALPGIFYLFDQDGRFLRWNRNFELITGYSHEEFSALNPLSFFSGEDRDRIQQGMEEAFSKGESMAQATLTGKEGQKLPYFFSGRLLEMDGRRCLVGMGVDISARLEAEEKTREAHDFLQAALNHSPSGILIAEAPDVRIRMANQAAFAIRGGAEESLVEIDVTRHAISWQTLKPDGSPFPPEQLPLSRAVLQGEVLRNEEAIIVNEDGSRHWVTANAAPIRDSLGNIRAGIVIFHDISEQKRMEQKLRTEEGRFRSLIENVNDLITQLDGTDLTILFQSPSSERLLGLSPEAMLGRRFEVLLHPDDVPALHQLVRRLLENGGESQVVEWRMRHAGGSLLTMETLGRKLHDERGTTLLLTSRDLTERRKLEEQFLQAQKMESIGQLAAGIAHDFNNLLAVILGTVDLSMSSMAAGDPLREPLQSIAQAGQRAAALTRQLLAFSRKQIMRPEMVDLNGVLDRMKDLLRRLVRENIELQLRLTENIGCVRVDPGQLEQVLINLVVNACDAMLDGGRLTLATYHRELSAREADNLDLPAAGPYVVLTVADTGTGMDGETMSRVFEPFFTTKAPGKGSGLGLSTAYGIVKQSSGGIMLQSEPGVGTTFQVFLPQISGVDSRKDESHSPSLTGGRETILVAEDESALRELVCQLLASIGYRVFSASSGEEALDLLRKNGRVDLMLTDVVMAGMSGRELAEHAGRLCPSMKILFTSGYTDEAIQHHGVLKEGIHFIGKPYTIHQLAHKVRMMLDEA